MQPFKTGLCYFMDEKQVLDVGVISGMEITLYLTLLINC
jgi:hypothetical protein